MDVWSERDDVEIRVLGPDNAALQTSVNHLGLCLGSKFFFIDLLAQGE